MRLTHATYDLIGHVSKLFMCFVQDNGIIGLLEVSSYNTVLVLLRLYRIYELNWLELTIDSLCSRPYTFYEWGAEAAHRAEEARKMETV